MRPPRTVTESAAAAAANRSVSSIDSPRQNPVGKRAVKNVAGRRRIHRSHGKGGKLPNRVRPSPQSIPRSRRV